MNIFSEEYLDWVAQETKDGKPLFCEDDTLDTKMVSGIRLLFKEVDKYARDFYVFNAGIYGNEYNIRDRDNLYRISILYGPNIAYRLNRDETQPYYLDLNEIRRKILSGKNNQLNYELMREIYRDINRLHAMGIPMDNVSEVINDQIRSLMMEDTEKRFKQELLLKQKNYSNE